MKKFSTGAAAVVAIVALAGTANAQVAAWGLFGNPGDSATASPTAQAPNVTASLMTRASGVSPSSANNCFSATGWDTAAPNDYFSFGFTVDAGYEADLASLIIATRSSGTGPGFMGLFYSGDGFSTNLHTFAQDNTNYLNSIVDLSGLPALTGAIEFRILPLNTTSAGGGVTSAAGTFRISDYYDGAGTYTDTQFTGSVNAVPTPGAAALMGLGGLVALRRRRGT